jgi:hypothetical protein
MLEFLINFIPDAIFHMLVIVGILGVLASFLLTIIPGPYRILIQAVAITILAFALFFEGALSNQKNWELKIAEAEKHIIELQVQSEKANAELISQLAENEKLIEENKYATRTEIVRIEKVINKECKITPDVIRIHNNATRVVKK